MPRNASGSYTLPSGNPVVSGTLIDATWANNTLADLGNEVTDSLSRSGEGAMLAPLRITDGVQATPSLAFSNEPSSGLYRAGSNEWWAVAAGVQNLRFTNTGLTTRAAAGAVGTPSIAAFNDVDTGIYFPGANELAIATGGAARMTFDSAGGVAVPGTFTLSGGTANGVLYLNGSKVATSGTALVFDGTIFRSTQLNIGTAPNANSRPWALNGFGYISGASGNGIEMFNSSTSTYGYWTFESDNRFSFNAIGGHSWTAGGAEKMRLTSSVLSTDSSISVGIGTTTPEALLTVSKQSSGGEGGYIYIDNPAASALNNKAGIKFGTSSGASFASFPTGEIANVVTTAGDGASALTFGTFDGTSSGTRMTLSAVGNLGIGTASPLSKLDVRSGYITGGTTAATNGSKLLANYYSSGAIGTWGTDYGSGGPVMGYGVWPSTTASGAFVSSSAVTLFRGAYLIDGSSHKWFSGASQTVAVDSAVTTTQAMTLDGSGNLFVSATGQAFAEKFRMYGNYAVFDDGTYQGLMGRGTQLGTGTASDFAIRSTNALAFLTNGANERARITAGGYFKASNTGTYANATNDRYEFSSDKDDINIIVRTTSTGASVVNLYSQFPAGPNAGAYHFAGAIAGSGYQFTVDADGDVKNTNGSYAAISDLKLKQDIEDAASQWDDIKAVRVRKYRFKRTPDAPLQIGVVAQELEQTSPGLVSEDADRDDENNDLGTTTKSVKYSILYMKAIKALQEAMARIESLEADMAALKGAA